MLSNIKFSRLSNYVSLLFFSLLLLSGCDNSGFLKEQAKFSSKLQIIPITAVTGTNDTLTQVDLPFQFLAVELIDGEYKDVTAQVVWNSSATHIASINKGVALGIQKGKTQIQAQSGNRLSNIIELEVRDEPVLVLQIKTSDNDHPMGTLFNKLPVGAKQTLKAIATYDDRTSFEVTHLVEWFSSHSNNVSVNNKNAVMLAIGTSEIHATFLGHKSNTLPFTVSDATLTNLKISPAYASTAINTQTQFTAIANYSDNTSQNVTNQVSWHHSNNLVKIENGQATALTAGTTQLTATLQDIESSQAQLSITDAKLIDLQITPTTPTLNQNSALFYQVKAIYDDGSSNDISQQVLWKSTNPEVSNVIASYAKGTQAGQTKVTAHYQGIESNTSTLTVVSRQLTSLQITPSLIELAQGTQAKLTVIAAYDDGTNSDVTDSVTWHTNSPEIALMTHGNVAAINTGDTTINAIFEGIESNEAQVSVIDSIITTLQITPAIKTTTVGSKVNYQAQATFSDGTTTTTQDVSHLVGWVSLHHNIASLLHTEAIGVTHGETTILAVLNNTQQKAHLTVSDKVINSLQITPAQQTLAQGAQYQYSAVANYNDNSSEDITEQVNWSTSNNNIATIYKGKVEAVSTGSVEIKAHYQGVNSNTAKLTVADIELIEIQITPAVAEIPISTYQTYRALGIYSNNTTYDITDIVHWRSNNSDVATIVLDTITLNQDENTHSIKSETSQSASNIFAIATGVNTGTASITAEYNDIKSNPATLTVKAATLQSLQLTPSNIELAKGTHIQYQVVGIYSDGSNLDLSNRVHWVNNHPEVATVLKGKATAVTQGDARIYATLQEITSNPANLTVTTANLASLQITPANIDLAKGGEQQYKAIATYSDQSSQDVTELASWYSAHTHIATIDRGLTHAINVGQSEISAHLDSHTSNNAILNVSNATLQELVLTPTNSTIANGTTQEYQVIGYFSDGSTKDLSQQVNWHNQQSNIVFMEGNIATSLASGKTIITASLGDINSNTADLTVSAAQMTAIQVTPAYIQTAKGTDVQYQAVAIYSDQSTQDITTDVAWVSSDTTIAILNSQGLAYAQHSGSAQIQASIDNINSNLAELKSTAATIKNIQVTPAVQTIALGTEQQYTATAIYTDNTTQDITAQAAWQSSNTTSATVIDGLAASLAVGNTDIRASFSGVPSNLAQLSVSDKQITKLQLSPSIIELAIGTSAELHVQATYTDGSSQDVTSSVNWQLSDNSYAAIDTTTNTVTATKQGHITLKALLNNGRIQSNSANLTITAAQLMSLTIAPEINELIVHNNANVTAYGYYSDNSSQDLSSLVNWSSNAPTKATVIAGHIEALTAGTVEIMASFQGVNSPVMPITIIKDTLQSISLAPDNRNIAKGTTQQFTLTGHYISGYIEDITANDNIHWQSSSPLLTIEKGGLATAIDESQNIVITATKSPENKSAQVIANITAPVITKLEVKQRVSHTSNKLTPQSLRQLFAYATFSDGSMQDVTTIASWNEDSQSTIATVLNGKVATVSPGSVQISAHFQGNISNNFIIEVRQPGNYSCAENDITIPFENKMLTFMCPLNTNEYTTATRTREVLGKNGNYGTILPMISYYDAKAYCESKGYKLPSIDELQALRAFSYQTLQSTYHLYEQYGWPTNGWFITSTTLPKNQFYLGALQESAGAPIIRSIDNQQQLWTCIKN
ncbi:Ig-like domain-containing protein [Shewanella marina]|uniref:Ig-like domain-containing protein n=1 Tax=Shewanella marina TaxID=487319 RepID=UPI0004715C19|nr:Ig-like domain-containing protein [Shewanella marina]